MNTKFIQKCQLRRLNLLIYKQFKFISINKYTNKFILIKNRDRVKCDDKIILFYYSNRNNFQLFIIYSDIFVCQLLCWPLKSIL